MENRLSKTFLLSVFNDTVSTQTRFMPHHGAGRRMPVTYLDDKADERVISRFALLSLALALVLLALTGCGLLGPLIGAAAPYAGVKMMFACIPERTRLDTPAGPRPIEQFEAGDLVIGFGGKPVRILQKHAYLENPETVFLRISFSDGASVDLCGMHRVAGIRARGIHVGETIAGRKVIGIESHRGVNHSFDLLTEDAGYQMHGVPVNSMIEEMNKAAATNGRSLGRGL